MKSADYDEPGHHLTPINIEGEVWKAKVPSGCAIIGMNLFDDGWFMVYHFPLPEVEETSDGE